RDCDHERQPLICADFHFSFVAHSASSPRKLNQPNELKLFHKFAKYPESARSLDPRRTVRTRKNQDLANCWRILLTPSTALITRPCARLDQSSRSLGGVSAWSCDGIAPRDF